MQDLKNSAVNIKGPSSSQPGHRIVIVPLLSDNEHCCQQTAEADRLLVTKMIMLRYLLL